jgi:hypothetical protein
MYALKVAADISLLLGHLVMAHLGMPSSILVIGKIYLFYLSVVVCV